MADLRPLTAYPVAIQVGDLLDVYGLGQVTVTKVGKFDPDSNSRSVGADPGGTLPLDTGGPWVIYRGGDPTDAELACADTGTPLGHPEPVVGEALPAVQPAVDEPPVGAMPVVVESRNGPAVTAHLDAIANT